VARVCVFDVNETLLDMGALDSHFDASSETPRPDRPGLGSSSSSG
jgi:hypothetical protein